MYFFQFSSLANRGNISIICYNALDVGTWDVTATTLDGEVTMSMTDSLLAKFFKDFALTESNRVGGMVYTNTYMKLAEDVEVADTPLYDTEIGERQLVFNYADVVTVDGSKEIVTEKRPSKNRETATYRIDVNDDGNYDDDDTVVAYVSEEVYESINNLRGKKVDILFGKDNEIVLMALVDESLDSLFVTAWDYADKEIEIDGEKYEFANTFTVKLFGNTYGTTATKIDDLLKTAGPLKVTNATRTFDRNVIADVILDDDGDIKVIDFKFSENFVEAGAGAAALEDIKVEVGVIEKLSSVGKISMIDGKTELNNVKVEDIDEDIRVIKDGEIVSSEDLEANDVVTVVSKCTTAGTPGTYTIDIIYASSEKNSGNVERVKNDNITVGENAYNVIEAPLFNDDGDITEPKATLVANDFYDEEVEVYLTFTGEIAAVVSSTEATDATLGVVTRDASEKTDSDDISYVSVKILKNDGTSATYKIYNEDKNEDMPDNAELKFTAGKVVLFSADADRVIKSDDIDIIAPYMAKKFAKAGATEIEIIAEAGTEDATHKKLSTINTAIVDPNFFEVGDKVVALADAEFTIDGKDEIVAVSYAAEPETDYDDKIISEDIGVEPEYKFNTSSVAYNTNADKLEKIAGWKSICADNDNLADAAENKFMLFVDANKRIKYLVASISTYSVTSEEYAVLVDIEYTKNEDEDKVYVATLYVDGEELTYELKNEDVRTYYVDDGDDDLSDDTQTGGTLFEEGDFVTYILEDDVIAKLYKKIAVNDLHEKELDAANINVDVLRSLNSDIVAATHKEDLTVDRIVDEDIFYIDDNTELDEITVDPDGYTVYDLRSGACEMFEGNLEDLKGELVIGFSTEGTSYADILVIVD